MKNLYYFGTGLDSAGHYFWIARDDTLWRAELSLKDIPFDPESFTGEYMKWNLPNGHAIYKRIDEWTVFAISGSPHDRRQGCKSVFFIQEELTYSEMVDRVISSQICREIMDRIKTN
jgi:hypothetical protein